MTAPETATTEVPKKSRAQRNKVKLRQKIKAKKPQFIRQESWRYKRVKNKWRRPKGVDSKMRKGRKGWPVSVNIGYGGPKVARGLHPSGYEEVLVYNLNQIDGLSSETQAIRIAHTVGAKKRRDMLTRARELGLHVLNPREIKETLSLPPEEETEKTEVEKLEKEETETVSEETEGKRRKLNNNLGCNM